MGKVVVGSLIIGAAILVAVGAFIYFSPFQSCVRANRASYLKLGYDEAAVQNGCLKSGAGRGL